MPSKELIFAVIISIPGSLLVLYCLLTISSDPIAKSALVLNISCASMLILFLYLDEYKNKLLTPPLLTSYCSIEPYLPFLLPIISFCFLTYSLSIYFDAEAHQLTWDGRVVLVLATIVQSVFTGIMFYSWAESWSKLTNQIKLLKYGVPLVLIVILDRIRQKTLIMRDQSSTGCHAVKHFWIERDYQMVVTLMASWTLWISSQFASSRPKIKEVFEWICLLLVCGCFGWRFASYTEYTKIFREGGFRRCNQYPITAAGFILLDCILDTPFLTVGIIAIVMFCCEIKSWIVSWIPVLKLYNTHQNKAEQQ